MTILSVRALDNKDSNHIKQKWTEPIGEIDKSSIMNHDLNTPLLVIYRIIKWTK